MSILTPVAAFASAAAARTDIPPISASLEAYYDATNSNYSDANNWKDVLSLGVQYTFDSGDTAKPTYQPSVNNGTYEYNGSSQSWYMGSTALSATINNLPSTSHTVLSLVNLDATTEEDIWSNGAPPSNGANNILLMVYIGRVRSHIWAGNGSGGTNVWSTDLTGYSILNNWVVVGQRFEISGGNATIDSFAYDGTTFSKSSAQTKTWGLPTLGPANPTYAGYRSFGSGRMDGTYSQAAIYTTNLSDADIQTVGDYMIAKL